MQVAVRGRARSGFGCSAVFLAFGYLLVLGLHLPSWGGTGDGCGKSSRSDAAGLARTWHVSLPEEVEKVYHCMDGQGAPYAGMSHFLFAIPGNRVESYFQSMDIEPKFHFDTRQGFEDVARMAGRDVSKVKRYESGSVSRRGLTYSLFVDEDAADSSAVYVEVISAG